MMSIIVHRLTREGEEHFNNWFARLRTTLQRQKGFVSVRAFADASDPGARHVVLEMENEAALLAWTSGVDKTPFLRELESVARQPWTALRLREIQT
jgi:heme-degrading monooxygenase HmoA